MDSLCLHYSQHAEVEETDRFGSPASNRCQLLPTVTIQPTDRVGTLFLLGGNSFYQQLQAKARVEYLKSIFCLYCKDTGTGSHQSLLHASCMLASSTGLPESENYVGEGGDPTPVQGQWIGKARLTIGHIMG